MYDVIYCRWSTSAGNQKDERVSLSVAQCLVPDMEAQNRARGRLTLEKGHVLPHNMDYSVHIVNCHPSYLGHCECLHVVSLTVPTVCDSSLPARNSSQIVAKPVIINSNNVKGPLVFTLMLKLLPRRCTIAMIEVSHLF